MSAKPHRFGLLNPVLEVIRLWLLVKYIAFVFVGAIMYIVSAPTLKLTIGDGTWVLGAAISLSAALCAIGVLSPRFELLEKCAGSVLVTALFVYAATPVALVVDGNLDRLLYSVIAIALLIIPSIRVVSLLMRTGVKSE